ncbi:hypothetical protein A4A49_53887 [Nicotiana attenuata]|uniref:Putative plant transposon protein domain-containing protein n=1 Tax=Nicotiana attenuata TaxID=49451 RepID=A0A314L5L7_NICAT|nr:hypothetical protein A4A49_53887 [Nicotiana attenuata]
MEKRILSSSTATRKCRRFQKTHNLKETVDLESSLDSDFLKTDNESSEASEDLPISQKKEGKRPMEQTPKKSACNIGKVESTDFKPEDKLNFYGPSEKSRFESYKSKSMVYGRFVSLSLMKNLHYDVIAIFDFQRLSSLFDTIGNSVYEEPVRMFYANMFVNDKDDLESMVLGTRIVLDSYQIEKIFSAKFHGYDVFVQNSWPKDFEVSLEEAKDFLSDNPPDIGPKNLKFEHRVLSHMIATTLLPKTRSLCTLTTRYIFILYYLVNNKRLHWFVWIHQYMLESIRDISSSAACLPYDFLISHILEVMKLNLTPFSPKHIASTYDKTAFSMMSYTLSDEGRAGVPNLKEIQQNIDGVKILLIAMKEHVDKIREVTKEIGTNVAKLRMDMGAMRRQGIRAFNSMTEKMEKSPKKLKPPMTPSAPK